MASRYYREESNQRVVSTDAFFTNSFANIYRGGNPQSMFNTGWSPWTNSLSANAFAAGDAYFERGEFVRRINKAAANAEDLDEIYSFSGKAGAYGFWLRANGVGKAGIGTMNGARLLSEVFVITKFQEYIKFKAHNKREDALPALGTSWTDWAGIILDAGDDLMRQVGQNFRALQVEVNSLRTGINFGKEIGKVNTATTTLKWAGRGLGAYNAINIEAQYRNGQIGSSSRVLEQGTNVFSTFGGIYGASWGVGWEIGRAITNIPTYQEWKQETWLPWRKETLGY